MTMTATTAEPMTGAQLRALQAEARKVNDANGWFEADRHFEEGIALIHTEVAEATEAYRRWGFEDATDYAGHHARSVSDERLRGTPPKPEGVGSELADVLIRLLDETSRQGIPLDHFASQPPEGHHRLFGVVLARVHAAVARLGEQPTPHAAAVVYAHLRAAADTAGVDLAAECARKVAFNATRGHRHGGKRL